MQKFVRYVAINRVNKDSIACSCCILGFIFYSVRVSNFIELDYYNHSGKDVNRNQILFVQIFAWENIVSLCFYGIRQIKM